MYICLGLPDHPECVGTLDQFISYFNKQGYTTYKPTQYSKMSGKRKAEVYMTDGNLFFDVTFLETVNILEAGNEQ